MLKLMPELAPVCAVEAMQTKFLNICHVRCKKKKRVTASEVDKLGKELGTVLTKGKRTMIQTH